MLLFLILMNQNIALKCKTGSFMYSVLWISLMTPILRIKFRTWWRSDYETIIISSFYAILVFLQKEKKMIYLYLDSKGNRKRYSMEITKFFVVFLQVSEMDMKRKMMRRKRWRRSRRNKRKRRRKWSRWRRRRKRTRRKKIKRRNVHGISSTFVRRQK